MYTLLNKKTGKTLTHPRVGLWFTPDIEEAKDMLVACKEYLVAERLDGLLPDFVIVDAESGKEVD